jgi:hypothetical protein
MHTYKTVVWKNKAGLYLACKGGTSHTGDHRKWYPTAKISEAFLGYYPKERTGYLPKKVEVTLIIKEV